MLPLNKHYNIYLESCPAGSLVTSLMLDHTCNDKYNHLNFIFKVELSSFYVGQLYADHVSLMGTQMQDYDLQSNNRIALLIFAFSRGTCDWSITILLRAHTINTFQTIIIVHFCLQFATPIFHNIFITKNIIVIKRFIGWTILDSRFFFEALCVIVNRIWFLKSAIHFQKLSKDN